MRSRFSRAFGASLVLALACLGCATAPFSAFRRGEGPVVASIHWEGVHAASRDELEAAILTSKANWRPWVAVDPFDPGTLQQDVERVRRLYRHKGFYEAEVRTEVEARGADAVIVRFFVTEGPQIALADFALSVEGEPTVVSRFDPTELASELPLVVGEPFSAERYSEAKRILLERFAERGHPDARISGGAEVRPADRTATLTWKVDPGPLIRFGPTSITGLERVDPDLPLGEVSWEVGEPYQPAALRETQRAIFDLGLFRSVSIRPIAPAAPTEVSPVEPASAEGPAIAPATQAEAPSVEPAGAEGPATAPAALTPPAAEPPTGPPPSTAEAHPAPQPATAATPAAPTPTALEPAAEAVAEAVESPHEEHWPFEIRVRERPPRSYRASIGFGTEDLARAKLEWKHRNLFGGLRSFKLVGKYSFLERGVEAIFEQPRFFGRPNNLTLDALFLDETPPVFHTRGIEAGWLFERRLAKGWRGRIGQRYELKRVRSVDADSTPLGEQENSTFQLVYFQLGLRRSTLDSEIDPRSGTLLDLSIEPSVRALGSDVDYLKNVLDARAFYPLPLRMVLASRVRLGTLEPYAGTQNSEVPIFKRFFAGGSTSVRGFDLDELGPRDRFNEPTGGLTLAEGSVELRFPIWKALGGVAFFDVGQVALDSFELRADDFFYSAGLGLRFKTPIGPLRLDVARLLNPPSGVDNYGVYFSVGHSF